MNTADIRPTQLAPWAFALSLLLHALLIAPQIQFSMPTVHESKVVNAKLIILPRAMAAPAPVPTKPQHPKKKITPHKTPVTAPAVALPPPPAAHATASVAQIEPASQQESSAPSPDANGLASAHTSTAPSTPPAETMPKAETKEINPAPVPAPAATPTPPTPTAPALDAKPQPHLPLNVELHYALCKGTNGFKVGKAIHTWRINDDNYVISSVIEATGIFAVVRPGQLAQTSQGKITAYGLQPEYFSDQRGQGTDQTFSAQFNWQNQTLIYGRVSEMTTVALPPQTQDQLSFVYQFALLAPFSGTVQFTMTNGRKLDTYAYKVVGEETLKTELGQLRTLHLTKVRQPNEDGVDIWLGADYQYLPVKIRMTDSDGGVAEQIVTAIRAK